MFVGGEFYADERWRLDEPVIDTSGSIFLNGGKACLTVIGEYLIAQGIREVLLPSYLCPSILNALGPLGLSFAFYQVQPDLRIDLEDLARQAHGQRAVYFINYFGFNQPPEARAALHALQAQGMLVIEDNAQAAFHPRPLGDFAFSSLRKFCAHDGGYLTTQLDVSAIIAKYADVPNRRLPVIRAYRKNWRITSTRTWTSTTSCKHCTHARKNCTTATEWCWATRRSRQKSSAWTGPASAGRAAIITLTYWKPSPASRLCAPYSPSLKRTTTCRWGCRYTWRGSRATGCRTNWAKRASG